MIALQNMCHLFYFILLIKYQQYNTEEVDNVNKLGHKLSNQEKSILKKIQKF